MSNLVLGCVHLQGACAQQTNQVYTQGFPEDIDALQCFLLMRKISRFYLSHTHQYLYQIQQGRCNQLTALPDHHE
jgi:hypothetical protein